MARMGWAALSLIAGCGGVQASTARAVGIQSPFELIPRDIDFVVRLDTQRLAGAGVPTDAAALAKAAGPAVLREVANAFRDARTIQFGGRIMSDGLHGDGVVALDRPPGAEPIPAPGPPFRQRSGVDASGVYDRADAGRDGAALVVSVAGGLVLATPAEMDAVLRVLEGGPDADRLDPPARGVVSFCGRMPAGLRLESPVLRAVTAGLLRYEGSVALAAAPATGLRAEAELIYSSVGEALTAAHTLEQTAERLAGSDPRLRDAAQSARVVRADRGLRIAVTVPFALFASVH